MLAQEAELALASALAPTVALLASSCFFAFYIPGRLWTYNAPEAAVPGLTGCRPVPHPKLASSHEASSCDPWYDHNINTSLCFHPRIQKAAPLGVNSDIPGKSCSKSCLVFTAHTVQGGWDSVLSSPSRNKYIGMMRGSSGGCCYQKG